MAAINPVDGDDSADMSITDTEVAIDVQSVDEGDVQVSREEQSIKHHTTTELTRREELLKNDEVCKQGDKPSGNTSRRVSVALPPYVVDLLLTSDVQTLSAILEGGCPVNAVDSAGWTALHRAASRGNVDVVEVLVERGASVDAQSSNGCTPLHLAAFNGHLGVVSELLRLGAQASMTVVAGEYYRTPLHQAAGRGHKEIVSVLLDAGCPIDVVNSEGCSALHFAAGGGAVEVIGVLVERGLDVNRENNGGLTPLHLASVRGKLEAVHELLRLGAQASMTVVAGKDGTPLHQAAVKGHKEIVSVLLDAGGPSDEVNIEGRSALHYAAGGGAVEIIGILIDRGLDVNIEDNDGWTPLHLASVCGELEAVRELLRLGAQGSMTVVAGKDGTPLHQAAVKGHKEIVSVLLDAGCPVDEVNIEGRSALHYAAAGGVVEIIGILIDRGLVVTREDNDGCTPLHLASAYGKLEAVHELLRLGAQGSMTVVAGAGGTPLHQAAVKGHKEIVSVLLDAGCPIDVVDIEGRSALHYAAIGGAVGVIGILIERGFNVNIEGNDGLTPLHLASVRGNLEAVRELLRLGAQASMTVVPGRYGTPLHQAAMKGHKEIVSVLLNAGCPIDVVNIEGLNALHYAAVGGSLEVVEVLSGTMFSSKAQQPAGSKVQEKFVSKLHHGSITSKNPLDCCSSAGYTPTMLAAMVGSVEVLKLLVSKHCDISVRSSFDLSIVEHAIMAGQMSKLIDMSNVFGVHAENTRALLSALQEKKLLDPSKLLILGSFAGDPLVIDTLSSEESVFTEAAHQTWTTTRRVLFEYYQNFDKEAIYDQLSLPDECPLSPLHISLMLLKYKKEYCTENGFIKAFHSSPEDNKPFIEKLISHPLTKFTVNKLFPNGLSPLDVARQFNFHDFACMIERAGGGPGMWADLPKEIKEKGINSLLSLKALHGSGGQEAALRIISHLFGGLPSVTSAEDDARGKILQSKPELRHVVKHVLSRLHHLDRWFDVGILLGVEEDELPTIQSHSKQDRVEAYRTMLSTWLKHGRHVTWQNLFDALWNYEPGRIVEEIKKNVAEELTQSQVRT